MRIETISYLKQHAASLDLDEPLVITQNGQAIYRIESEQLAKQRDQGIALLKLMNLAERDIKAGRVEGVAQVKDRLRTGMAQGQVGLNDRG